MISLSDAALVGAAAVFLAGPNSAAFAHAELRRSIPAIGTTVPTAPTEVLVNFSEPLESPFSSIVVRDVTGNRVDKADAHVDPDDRTTMHVSLKPLAPGNYTVLWHAVTTDTHRTEGSYAFRVGAPPR
jgi:methionine-rich copper-binding protein CopC